jgi:hypothetical protein
MRLVPAVLEYQFRLFKGRSEDFVNIESDLSRFREHTAKNNLPFNHKSVFFDYLNKPAYSDLATVAIAVLGVAATEAAVERSSVSTALFTLTEGTD